MRILLFGGAGQLGTALQARLAGHCVAPSHADCSLTAPEAVRRVCDQVQPDVIINAAAYNRVDLAESEPDAAWQVNALGPRTLAAEAKRRDCAIVHVSTDHVFASPQPLSRPWRETDLPTAGSVYAVSKLAGEQFVQAGCPRHFVLRTCGLYGPARSAGKGNFVTTMLRLAGDRPAVRVVADQVCTPTSAADLAEMILGLLPTAAHGLYHATNSGAVSWHAFAEEVFRLAGLRVRVTPITTQEYAAPAIRPAYSVLDGAKLAGVLGRSARDWKVALAEYVSSLETRG